jgi:hypothetical protein
MESKGVELQIVFTLPKTLRFESIRRLYCAIARAGMIYGMYAVSTEDDRRGSEVVRLRGQWMSDSRMDAPAIILENGSSLSVGLPGDLRDLGLVSEEGLKNFADYLVMVEASLPTSSGGIHRSEDFAFVMGETYRETTMRKKRVVWVVRRTRDSQRAMPLASGSVRRRVSMPDSVNWMRF